jgi:SulP family sulfate permease
MTDTLSNKSQECLGQGASNIASALIGQSVINVTSGGRGRLSTFVAGGFLLFLILVLDDLVRVIPMAALVAVMIMVSIGTFSWRSILDLRTNPPLVVGGHAGDGVHRGGDARPYHRRAGGRAAVGRVFAGKVSRLVAVGAHLDEASGRVTYVVSGQIFFASAEVFLRGFDFDQFVRDVVIGITHAHFWDITAIGALDKAVLKFRKAGRKSR